MTVIMRFIVNLTAGPLSNAATFEVEYKPVKEFAGIWRGEVVRNLQILDKHTMLVNLVRDAATYRMRVQGMLLIVNMVFDIHVQVGIARDRIERCA